MYIKPPAEKHVITTLKGNPLDVHPAKREDVPASYRKQTGKKVKTALYELMLYFVGLTELFRKET